MFNIADARYPIFNHTKCIDFETNQFKTTIFHFIFTLRYTVT